MLSRVLKKLLSNPFDRVLKKAQSEQRKKFLVIWNRGLGDIALGLYALVYRIREVIPEAEITFLTRSELVAGFLLLPNVSVIEAPWWQRGDRVDLKETLQRLGLPLDSDAVVFEKVDATRWFSWQLGRLTPRLQWQEAYDELWKKFELPPSKKFIGVHLSTETQKFYGYKKDWPLESWQKLFHLLASTEEAPSLLLFGLNTTPKIEGDGLFDLRGKTHLLEMLSLIKNCCHTLIAPDGGVLSLVYYLDVSFPLRLISLWSDPHQGILKQAVISPNPQLEHFPLLAKGGNLAHLPAEVVLEGFYAIEKA